MSDQKNPDPIAARVLYETTDVPIAAASPPSPDTTSDPTN